jgi:HPt (histidine-containing phosphotransfer) domain-containing protein
MPQPLSDYFAQEAGEFLDQLDTVLAAPGAPDPDRLWRLARGVRGSAQLAGDARVAEVAGRLEDAAHALREGRLQWSDDVRDRARRTAADLRALVSTPGDGGGGDRAREAVERWADVAGRRRQAAAAPPADQLVAFVRREIGAVVEALDQVVSDLGERPGDKEPLRTVLRRMRPVRGVAGMETLSAVLELLEGVEDAAHAALSRPDEVRVPELYLLGAARDGLRAAERALDRGEPPGDAPEMDSFRRVRDHTREAEGDGEVLPIAALFRDDAGPHIVSSPKAPVGAVADGALPDEVETFLRIEATGFLDRAEGLIATGGARDFERVARQLAELAASVEDLAGTYGLAALATAAGAAAERLREAEAPEAAREALRSLRAAIPGAPGAETAVAGDAPAPDAPAAEPGVGAAEAAEAGVVPIESLLYDPDRALREALALRERIEALVGDRRGALGTALDDLFGLIELGLERRAS